MRQNWKNYNYVLCIFRLYLTYLLIYKYLCSYDWFIRLLISLAIFFLNWLYTVSKVVWLYLYVVLIDLCPASLLAVSIPHLRIVFVMNIWRKEWIEIPFFSIPAFLVYNLIVLLRLLPLAYFSPFLFLKRKSFDLRLYSLT